MAKRKIPERAKDCVTLEQKIAFSTMVREQWEALDENPWSKPSDFGALLDAHDDPECPWSHPEWAAAWARSEAEKMRAVKRALKEML